jgi:hypothetical protein
MSDAFNRACEDAQEEYGNDSYNGQINNCQLAGDVTHKRGQFKEDDFFHEHILENVGKREVKGYCERKPKHNTNKIQSVVKNFPQKGTRKWITKYQAINSYTDEVVAEDVSQTGCIKKGRDYVEVNPNVRLVIKITKQLVGGTRKVAEIQYKKASNEKNGLYTFVGWAPE